MEFKQVLFREETAAVEVRKLLLASYNISFTPNEHNIVLLKMISPVSQVQTGATPPSTAHLHPLPHIRYVSFLDVDYHVMRREMGM